MALLDHIIARAPRADSALPEMPSQWPAIEIVVPAADVEMAPPAAADEPDLWIEPIVTAIEYTDAAGHHSRRRITMLQIRRSASDYYVLMARCHERRASRTFRLDRIEAFIEPDGEVVAPAAFFRETLDIDLGQLLAAARPRPAAPATSAYTQLRRALMPALLLLAAAARADDLLHPEEVDRIMRYAEREAPGLRDAGAITARLTVEDIDRVGRLILRTRPTQDDVVAAITDLRGWPEPALRSLWRALGEVVVADGIVVADERAFLAEVIGPLHMEGE